MEVFRDRIARVQRLMDQNGILLLPAVPAQLRNRDTHFPYRASSDLLYCTGVNEEELSLILTKNTVHIFARVSDPERERWVGRVKGHAFFLERLGKGREGRAFASEPHEFERQFAELAKGKTVLYHDFGRDAALDTRLFKILHDMAEFSRRGVFGPRTITRAALLMHECRLFKDSYDLECMRKAAAISAAAHNKAQDLIEGAAGTISEFEVKALIEHEFMKAGADRLAYPSIVAAAANATVLHYEGSAGSARQGDFILIDAGCEYEGYASDITRTTIVGGKSRGGTLRNDLYGIVLAAQRRAISETGAGKTIEAVHAAAVEVLAQGLLDLGFFKSVPLRKKGEKPDAQQMTSVASLGEAIELEYYSLFYMHRTSHYLGLDVHDVGDYFTSGKSRALAPGMVITVEPGLYFPEEYDFIVPEARGLGIRIEDDVLVTEAGNEVLTSACRS